MLGQLVADLLKEYPEANSRLVMHQSFLLQEQYRIKHGAYQCIDGLNAQEQFAYDAIKMNLEKNLYVGKVYDGHVLDRDQPIIGHGKEGCPDTLREYEH